MKKVSIIIPCYNVENYIWQCLESVINQTYQNLEIICINDGSNDGTLRVLKEIETREPRLIILNQSNKGLSASRNVGIHKSSGDYIMFLDSDDWLEIDAVKICATYLPYDLICFSYNRVFKKTVLPRKLNLAGSFSAEKIQQRMVGLVGKELGDPSQADSLVTAWGKLYDSAIIRNNNIQFTDTQLIGTEDALFNIQFLDWAKTVYVLDRPFYNYRRNNVSSLTSFYKKQLFEKWKNLYAIIAEIIEDKPTNFKIALQNRICLSIIGLGLNETFSTSTFQQKSKTLKRILSDPLYKMAFDNLYLNQFPLKWKVFFYLAKYKKTHLLLIFLMIIKHLIYKK